MFNEAGEKIQGKQKKEIYGNKIKRRDDDN